MPPGEVCPAMVRLSLPVLNSDFNRMVPATSKTMVLGPFCFKAQRKVPCDPSSSKEVT